MDSDNRAEPAEDFYSFVTVEEDGSVHATAVFQVELNKMAEKEKFTEQLQTFNEQYARICFLLSQNTNVEERSNQLQSTIFNLIEFASQLEYNAAAEHANIIILEDEEDLEVYREELGEEMIPCEDGELDTMSNVHWGLAPEPVDPPDIQDRPPKLATIIPFRPKQ